MARTLFVLWVGVTLLLALLVEICKVVLYLGALAGVIWLALYVTAQAQGLPPDPPPGGLVYFHEGQCSDVETGQSGYCYLGRSANDVVYMVFHQNGVMMMIREVLPEGGYITIWVSDNFNSI